jgi:hypothetical protein
MPAATTGTNLPTATSRVSFEATKKPDTPPTRDDGADAIAAAAPVASVGAPVAAEPAPALPRPSAPPAILEPAPSLPESAPARPAPAATNAVSETVAPRTAASSEAPVPAPAIDPERLVRATLRRYETAYSELNAAAASTVWPSVDRRALARAFDALAAQNVWLGACDVRVSGATAQAQCKGTATWTPKVGSGTQTTSRTWRFNLTNEGDTWVIVQANVK